MWSPAFGLVSVDANGVMVAMTLTAPQQASTPLPESQADDILNLAAKACDMVKLQCPDLVCGGQTRTTAVPLTLNVMLNGRRIATWDYVARKGKMLVAVTSESK